MYQKFYPVFGRLGGETCTESLKIRQVKLITLFLQSAIQKTITWWSIFFGDAAKKHKQIDKTIIKHRYRVGWFIYRSKYNLDHCTLIIYWFWITIIVVIAAGASCGLVVPNEILTQYLKRKGYSGLEKNKSHSRNSTFVEHFIPNASTTKNLLKLILIKLKLNSKIMKTWEFLTVKNQV